MISRLKKVKAILAAGALIACTSAFAAEKPKPQDVKAPPYDIGEALRTIINPHEQINDEGEVLWQTCLICHTETPDIIKSKSIKDVKLRFDDDLNQICYRCHSGVKPHPAAEESEAMMSGYKAPDHLVVPSKVIKLNMRLILKDIPTILPVDPKSGKIFCATCHNPHERGLLVGRADYGADHLKRLRSAGLDICQYCHRK